MGQAWSRAVAEDDATFLSIYFWLFWLFDLFSLTFSNFMTLTFSSDLPLGLHVPCGYKKVGMEKIDIIKKNRKKQTKVGWSQPANQLLVDARFQLRDRSKFTGYPGRVFRILPRWKNFPPPFFSGNKKFRPPFFASEKVVAPLFFTLKKFTPPFFSLKKCFALKGKTSKKGVKWQFFEEKTSSPPIF